MRGTLRKVFWDLKAYPCSGKPLPKRPHLLIFPKQSANWGTRIQIYESMGTILFQLLQNTFFRGIEVFLEKKLIIKLWYDFNIVSWKNGQWKNYQWDLIPMCLSYLVRIVFSFPSVKLSMIYYFFWFIIFLKKYSDILFFYISSFNTESNTKKQSMLVLFSNILWCQSKVFLILD